MNERIKLLAEQAKIEFTYDPTETPMRAFAECWEDELEKFAELIVKECVGVVKGGHFLHDQAPTALFAKECSGAIKRHFGVSDE